MSQYNQVNSGRDSDTDDDNRDFERISGGSGELRSETIRSEIEATRSGMSETVDAIQAKLTPQNLQENAELITERAKKAALEVAEQTTDRVKQAALDVSEQAATKLRETVTQLKQETKDEIRDATLGRVERMVGEMREKGTSIMETVKANPIPAALVGVGLAWLFMGKSDQSSSQRRSNNGYGYAGYNNDDYDYGYGRSYRQGQSQGQSSGNSTGEMFQQKVNQVKDSVSEAADSVKEKTGDFVNQAQEQVGQIADQVQEKAHRVMDRSYSFMDEYPLATGVLTLALGAAVGLMLPETQRENELMGEARNKLVGQVGDIAQNTVEKAQKLATDAMQSKS